MYRSKARINEFVCAFESSGQTQQQFCLEHDLRPATFSSWLRKRRATQVPEGFRELRLGFGSSGALTVRLPEGIEVEFPHPANPAEGRFADPTAQTGRRGIPKPTLSMCLRKSMITPTHESKNSPQTAGNHQSTPEPIKRPEHSTVHFGFAHGCLK